MTTAPRTVTEIGAEIGRSIARDVLATPDMDHAWTGIDAQDGDRLTAQGIEPDTDAWTEAEAAAEAAYLAAVRA